MSAALSGRQGKDRRSVARYRLSLPIVVYKVVGEHTESVAGITRDISIRGLYFTTEQEITPGCELEFAFTLPAELTQDTEVFVSAKGKVLRSEREGTAGGIGLATVIEKYEIVRATPSLS